MMGVTVVVALRVVALNWGYGADLSAYRDAVVAVNAGVNPYVVHTHMNFVYPPSFLILMGWMSGLSDQVLGGLWQAMLIISLIGSLLWFLTWKEAMATCLPAGRPFQEETGWLLVVLTWLFFPVGFALGMGQVSLLLLGLLTLTGYCQSRKYHTSAGILIGIAGAIKLTPLIWLLVAVKERRYKTVLVGLATFGGLNLASVVYYGDAGLWRGFMEVMKASVVNQSVYYFNQGLPALMYRLGFGNWVWLMTALIWAWCWWMMGRVREPWERLALVAAVATLSASIAWQHHLVMYLPLIWISFKKISAKSSLTRWVWWWTVVMLIGMNLKQPGQFAGSSLIYNHAVVGGVLLVWGQSQFRKVE